MKSEKIGSASGEETGKSASSFSFMATYNDLVKSKMEANKEGIVSGEQTSIFSSMKNSSGVSLESLFHSKSFLLSENEIDLSIFGGNSLVPKNPGVTTMASEKAFEECRDAESSCTSMDIQRRLELLGIEAKQEESGENDMKMEMEESEEEAIMFSDRAHLYHFDATILEWKHIGEAELTVLFYPRTSSRFLLRWGEIPMQLNCTITPDFKITPRETGESYYFIANIQGVTEHLTVRFRDLDIACQFEKMIKECIEIEQDLNNL